RNALGHSKADRINTLIVDMIETSFDKPYIHQSKEIEHYTLDLHDFMYKNVYLSKKAKPEEGKAVKMLEILFNYFLEDPARIPDDFFKSLLEDYPKDRVIADYISSFTDHYCVEMFENIFIPKFWNK
nr:deoxyguanosinetriphosphate triphosphohydrolase [Clostridia bacterium]